MGEFGSVSFPHVTPPAYRQTSSAPRTAPKKTAQSLEENRSGSVCSSHNPCATPQTLALLLCSNPHPSRQGWREPSEIKASPRGPGLTSARHRLGPSPGADPSPEPPPAPRQRGRRGRQDLLEESCDVLPAAAGPGEWGRVIQELWRHDERSFPNWLTVIAASIMLNPKTV